MFVKVLEVVFKMAWRELTYPKIGSINYLAVSREFRNRLWWEGIKDLKYMRSQAGLVHSSMGGRTEWEDVLVKAFGVSWRHMRDECPSLGAWLRLLPRFVEVTCNEWGLPLPSAANKQDDSACAGPPGKRLRTTTTQTLQVPTVHGENCTHITWERAAGCFAFIVDCHPLAETMNGRCPLHSQELVPAFERMTCRLFGLLEEGWIPNTRCSDPVTWHRRDSNKIADYLVNYTMDNQQDWSHVFIPTDAQFSEQSSNFLCHSDGGTRAGSCSAAAWYIEALIMEDGSTRSMPYAMGGKFLHEPISSFTTELIALDESIAYITNMVKKTSRRSTKRARTV